MNVPDDLSRCIILGIDPAIASIGFGAIRGNHALEYGVITTPSNVPTYERLSQIRSDIAELCNLVKPEIVALEMPFLDAKTRMPARCYERLA